MIFDVKPVKRQYDGSRRLAASAQTRQRILDEALDRFVDVGYRGTTIAAVAQRAEVSVATVYELVGRKPTILRDLIEQAISGRDHSVAAMDRGYVKAITAEPQAGGKLAIYAAATTAIQQRMSPLFLALRDASSTDDEALTVWTEIAERRAANMRAFARDLHGTGRLRNELRVDDVADVIWATASAEFYVLLTAERGWSPSQFQAWLTDTWERTLLD